MTDDLVKRLRMWVYECEEQHGPGMWAQDMSFAADRIKELEDALQRIAKANNSRDRYSPVIDAIVIWALKKDNK